MHIGRKNGFIDVQKFIYAWLIVAFHFGNATTDYLPGGASAVEFFVLTSGIFFFTGWEKKKQNIDEKTKIYYPLQFFKQRFLRFFPYTTICFIPCFLGERIVKPLLQDGNIMVGQVAQNFSKDIWELLLVSMNGMNNNANLLNGPVWTISSMLLAEFIIIGILVNSEKVFATIVAPLTIIVGYGFWRHVESADLTKWIGFTTFGTLRVFMLTCIAYYLVLAINVMKDMSYTRLGQWILGGIELLCHVCAIAMMACVNTRYFRWAATLVFSIAIVISLSNKAITARWFKSNRITNVMSALSMEIYLSHWLVLQAFKLKFSSTEELFAQKGWFFLAVAVTGVLFHLFMKWFWKIWPMVKSAAKNKLYAENA